MNLTLCLTLWMMILQSGQSADVAELARLESVWNDAHMKGDAAALDSLWADDLVLTVPGMAMMAKSDAIGMWRSGQVKFRKYETLETKFRVYDNTAIVTGRLKRSRDFGGRVADDDWRFTKVYMKRQGKWLVVAFHASPAAL